MVVSKLVLLIFFIQTSHQINNGLGRTPQMGKILRILYISGNLLYSGWNSWNHFGCNINEKLIQQTADIIVATGLAAAGYQYGLNIHSILSKYLCVFLFYL
jgi:hypothetical protein